MFQVVIVPTLFVLALQSYYDGGANDDVLLFIIIVSVPMGLNLSL